MFGIVRGQGVIDAARQQNFHQLDEVCVDIFFAGKCDLRGFLVGALDQADAAADVQQIADVLLASVEVCLNNGPHRVGFRAGLLDDAQRPVRVGRSLPYRRARNFAVPPRGA